MTTNSENLHSQIVSLLQDSGFQSEVAQIQAKALLYEITGQVPQYKWTYIVPRVIRNATMAILGLEAIAEENPDEIDKLSYPARTFALLWE